MILIVGTVLIIPISAFAVCKCNIDLNLDLNLNSHVNSYWIDNSSLAPGVF